MARSIVIFEDIPQDATTPNGISVVSMVLKMSVPPLKQGDPQFTAWLSARSKAELMAMKVTRLVELESALAGIAVSSKKTEFKTVEEIQQAATAMSKAFTDFTEDPILKTLNELLLSPGTHAPQVKKPTTHCSIKF